MSGTKKRDWIRVARTGGGVTVVCTLACCSSARNDRLGVGERTLPAFGAPAEPRGNDGPSPGVMDRSAWTAVTLDVPVDGTIHQPTYRLGAWTGDRPPTARQRGRYPDPASALDTRGNPGARVGEMFVAPLAAALEIVLFPVHAVMTPPWSEAASPASAYERAERGPRDTGGEAARCPLCPKPERGS